MKVIGLTGSIGSGKSTVGKVMEQKFSVKLLMTDDIGHKLMEKGQSCYMEIVSVFGHDILDKDENINRNALGQIVFHDESKLQVLNGVIHPKVTAYLIDDIKLEKERMQYDYYVIESAILFQSGLNEICDECWYVDAKEEIRRKRLIENRGYREEKIDSIMEAQRENHKYKTICHQNIDNNYGTEDIYGQLEKLLV